MSLSISLMKDELNNKFAELDKPHACCLFAAIHCEKPFISIRV